MWRQTDKPQTEASTKVLLTKWVQVWDKFYEIWEHEVDVETLEKIKVFKSVQVL